MTASPTESGDGLPPPHECPACGYDQFWLVDEPLFRPGSGELTYCCQECGKVFNARREDDMPVLREGG